jgi:hypothetical protein
MNHPWDVCPMGQKKWGIKNSRDVQYRLNQPGTYHLGMKHHCTDPTSITTAQKEVTSVDFRSSPYCKVQRIDDHGDDIEIYS